MAKKHMDHKLTKLKPCENCPFACNVQFGLGADRAAEIVEGLLCSDKDFACHKTPSASGQADGVGSLYVGAAIFLERNMTDGTRGNRSFRIREAIGEFTPAELSTEVAVFESQEAFVEARAVRARANHT